MNLAQLQALISYMEDHPKFAAHQYMGCMGSNQRLQQLTRLTDHLNGLGDTKKEAKAWERTWAELRAAAKAQNAKYNKYLRMTGNPVHEHFDLDLYLVRISNLMGGRNCDGLAIVPESGVKKTEFLDYKPNQQTTHQPRIQCLNVDKKIKMVNNAKPFTENLPQNIASQPTYKPNISQFVKLPVRSESSYKSITTSHIIPPKKTQYSLGKGVQERSAVLEGANFYLKTINALTEIMNVMQECRRREAEQIDKLMAIIISMNKKTSVL